MTPADGGAAGWIEWSGGVCPVDEETIVEIKGGDGCVEINSAGYWCWDWLASWPESNIVAYRVVQP